MKAAILLIIFSVFSTTAFSQWQKYVEDIDADYRAGDYIGAAKNNTQFKKKLEKSSSAD